MIVAVGVGILILAAWIHNRRNAGDAPIYRTATIERGNVKSTVSATGTLNAVQTIQVGTQVSGQIAAIYADYNDRVRKGQLLASIDPSLQNQAVEEAQAQLERAVATMQQAQDDYARNKALYDLKFIAPSEFSAVQSNYSVQKANVRSAQIALDRARQNLSYTRIYAPINGVIVERNVDVGQTVAANFSAPQLFLIANDLFEMQILALVDESDIGAIKTGQPVEFTVQAYPDETFTGTVQQVRLQSKTQDNVVNYTAVVGVKNTTGKLLPGMTATVQFLTGQAQNVLIVPNSALRVRATPAMFAQAQHPVLLSDGQAGGSAGILWTLDRNGKLDPVHVQVGLSDETHTEVTAPNLAAGTKVVIGVIDAGNGSDEGSKSPFENPRPAGGGEDKGG
ncbi:MAG TPA: efflux RND transporter periplasmic adaptor subunit [Gemmatimonadaceae bacterium]|jgi:HlyD family secretion protein|nr:efflux RND transporter periplasmic adaptor subunit [Gemmatimonadaceae bacterium]